MLFIFEPSSTKLSISVNSRNNLSILEVITYNVKRNRIAAIESSIAIVKNTTIHTAHGTS